MPLLRVTIAGLTGFAAIVAATLVVGTQPAAAVQVQHDRIVSDNPAGWTPHVLDGHVKAIVQAGDTIILGGRFTQVSSADGETVYDRSNMVAFSASTGEISTTFVPNPDDEVTALAVSGDGRSVYAGGYFDTVAGGRSKTLAKLSLSTGRPVSGFTAPAITGRIKDMKLSGDRLWIGGTWTHVDGQPQAGLATLDPTTGDFDPYHRLTFSDPYNDATMQIMKFDISPNGERLVAMGNFSAVEGEPRQQLAVLDIGGSSARLANWQTDFYGERCAAAYDSYMRDLDISPDGRYFVVTTTGAWRGSEGPCDTTSRWELGVEGTGLTATWVDYSGGDTMYAVEITGSAVYIGGHFRWQNNPNTLDGDSAGAGAVGREGIAALDPANGLPLRWNPGRTKGVGVFDMLATSEGLWVGSDTDRIGNWEYHGRIAFMPLDGGSEPPAAATGGLPGDVYLQPMDHNSPVYRAYDGATVGETQDAPTGGLNWNNLRGAVMVDERLYYGWGDGGFLTRKFDASAYGTATDVDGADLLVPDRDWHNDVENITGMFYTNGRIYYTLADEQALYYRYFSIESNVVGATRFIADQSTSAGLDYSNVQGMFVDGTDLYWADATNGGLHRVDFVDGQVVDETDVVVSGPDADGNDWRSRGSYIFTN